MIDVQQRTAHVMVADLERAFAFVRHVAIGARHAGARVDALVPHFEFRMLRLEHRRAGLRVRPILELLLVVVGEDVLDLQPVRPRIDQPLLRPLEVILHVALAADEAPHLLPRGVAVHVVILHALRWL